MEIKSIKSNDLATLGDEWEFLDVREGFERSGGHLKGLHIPLKELEARIAEIPTEKPILVYCRSGVRSITAIKVLHALGRRNQFLNLEGGMLSVHRINRS